MIVVQFSMSFVGFASANTGLSSCRQPVYYITDAFACQEVFRKFFEFFTHFFSSACPSPGQLRYYIISPPLCQYLFFLFFGFFHAFPLNTKRTGSSKRPMCSLSQPLPICALPRSHPICRDSSIVPLLFRA